MRLSKNQNTMKLTKQQLLEQRIRTIIQNIKEENSLRQNVKIQISNGFKDIRSMMQIIENTMKDNLEIGQFWETYTNTMQFIKKKLDDIDKNVSRSK